MEFRYWLQGMIFSHVIKYSEMHRSKYFMFTIKGKMYMSLWQDKFCKQLIWGSLRVFESIIAGSKCNGTYIAKLNRYGKNLIGSVLYLLCSSSFRAHSRFLCITKSEV